MEETPAFVKELEVLGLKEMKAMNQTYLESGRGSSAVREFLKDIAEDESFLLLFLRGRQHRSKHAGKTVKRYAKMRFDKFPEAFSPAFSKQVIPLIDNHIFGILRNQDSKGRVVGYFNASKWDTEKYPTSTLIAAAIHFVERLFRIEDAVENEVVFIQECGGVGLEQLKYTLYEMVTNVFLHSYPIQLKGVYFVNVPYIPSVVYKIIRLFFPKGLKKREKFVILHEQISSEILPKCLGGILEDHEAIDPSLLKIDS